jgi:hypothetical protein
MRGNVLRGIAPQSGAGPLVKNCKGPVATAIIHGNADPNVLPAEGVKSRDDHNLWSAAPKTIFDFFATLP